MVNKKINILVVLLLISLVLSIGCTKKEDTGQKNQQGRVDEATALTVKDLYPLNVGDYWKFAGIGNEYAPFEQKVLFREGDRVQLQVENAGATSAMIYEFRDGQLVVVYMQEELYEEENILHKDNQMEIVLLKEPIEVGATWETQERTYEIKEIGVTVETPAGKFEESVKIVATFQGNSGKIILFYKPGLGLVKQDYQDGEFIVVQ